MKAILVALLALTLGASAARAENPDGAPGTVWLDFAARPVVAGHWNQAYGSNATLQKDRERGVEGGGVTMGLGYVLGPAVTFRLGLDTETLRDKGNKSNLLLTERSYVRLEIGARFYLHQPK